MTIGPRPTEHGPTATLAAFAAGLRSEDLSGEERHAAGRHLLDTLGACIAGATGHVTALARDAMAEMGKGGAVPVPGFAGRFDPLTAAWLGGVSAHGLEVDDGYRAGSVHPGAVVIPAVLSAAAGKGVDGRRLITAIAVGYELSTRLAEAMHPASRNRGFHNTPVVGVMAAAAAVGSLYRLPPAAMEMALGIAASSAAGLFAFLHGGGEIKRLHAGFAAREGLLAAVLAQKGMTGPRGVLEVEDGYFQAYSGMEAGDRLVEGLWPRAGGRPLNITRCYVKPYACCRHIHPAIDAVLAIMDAEGASGDEIATVQSATYAIAEKHAHGDWRDMATAQLSYQFCVATAMRHGELSIRRFDDASRSDEVTQSYCEKVAVTIDEECQASYPSLRSAKVTVTLRDGRQAFRFIDEPSGSARHPLSDEALKEKYLGLAGPVMGIERAQRAAELVDRIEALDRADDLLAALARPQA
ncbi:2-methylcitrate dehydratase PrpD [Rhodoligotrophos appendicifer]|uniref:MmgE/PrpD family protein n=1 Tax=Rhodoligotrophos appendicifer TaxID=987056 RepID=UPI001185577F|nr:MmgE/PrpD family protein [Rhodoligotrophos appendicifer]